MGSDGSDASAFHEDDPVRILDAGHTLGDDDLGGLRNELSEAFADQGVGTGINGAGGVVQDQNLGLLKQCSCDTQTLLLAAGNVGTALLDPGIVFVRELLDKFISLGQTACLLKLRVRGVGIAPAQVVFDGAGEKHVLLKHYGYLISQGFQVVAAHGLP